MTCLPTCCACCRFQVNGALSYTLKETLQSSFSWVVSHDTFQYFYNTCIKASLCHKVQLHHPLRPLTNQKKLVSLTTIPASSSCSSKCRQQDAVVRQIHTSTYPPTNPQCNCLPQVPAKSTQRIFEIVGQGGAWCNTWLCVSSHIHNE